nr:MAG TPA: hypothetical protein [Caudoviricetes sp.]
MIRKGIKKTIKFREHYTMHIDVLTYDLFDSANMGIIFETANKHIIFFFSHTPFYHYY